MSVHRDVDDRVSADEVLVRLSAVEQQSGVDAARVDVPLVPMTYASLLEAYGYERFPLDPDHMARVAPATKRKVWPGAEGIRMVVIGGVPGEAYEAPDRSKLGEPDPMRS